MRKSYRKLLGCVVAVMAAGLCFIASDVWSSGTPRGFRVNFSNTTASGVSGNALKMQTSGVIVEMAIANPLTGQPVTASFRFDVIWEFNYDNLSFAISRATNTTNSRGNTGGGGATTDTTAPANTTASNFINSGASSASSTSVTLSISATDAVGVTGYYASETSTAPTASASGWVSVTSATSYSNSSVSFTLSGGNGTKTVYVWFKDAAGNVSSSASDTITLSTTIAGGTTVTDVDGKVYNTVTIGAQTWMKENLVVTKYRNGDAIPTTTANISFEASPKYQWAYSGLESNVSTYGRLYTWYAATDSRGVCPSGWHLPTDAEWTTLTNYLGGLNAAGGHLKEAGTTHWSSPNTGAENSSGFTALPGGYRHSNGTFYDVGYSGDWWSATDLSSAGAWYRGLFHRYGYVDRNNDYKYSGFSVRCVMDEGGTGRGTGGGGATSDATAPRNATASNFINSGASSTTSTAVTLSISATDAVGVTGYYVSETSTTPTASAAGWVSVTSATSYSNSSVSFTLSSGNGTKTVRVWFKDAAGNVSSSVSDTITLSTTSTGAAGGITFTDNGNGTVTDSNGLMWQQGENATYNWYMASGTSDNTYNPSSTSVCGSLSLGGYSGWRLPTIDELRTLIDTSRSSAPYINTTAFPNARSSFYWSSTAGANNPSYAWYVDFYNGYVSFYSKSSNDHARCVRGGQ